MRAGNEKPSPKAGTAEPKGQAGAQSSNARRYRLDAQLLFFGSPFYTRSAIGGGRAVWEETGGSGPGSSRLIEFNGFSDPDRACGVNRVGIFRETSRLAEAHDTESTYIGVLTADATKEGNRALKASDGSMAYTAIDGRLAPGRAETFVARFQAPARLPQDRHTELLDRARQALATAPSRPPEFDVRNSEAGPLLTTLLDMLRNPGRNEANFVYEARLYRLSLRRVADSKSTAYFRQKGLIPAGENVVQVSGKVRKHSGAKLADFRIWAEETSNRPIPLRIEYQPKSYLKILFEAEG